MISLRLPFLLLSLALPSLVHGQEIRWRIENPYRLFRHAADFDKLRIPAGVSIEQWFSGIADRIDDDFLPYRRTHWEQAVWPDTSGRYSPGYLFPTSHKIILGWSGAAAGQRCDWRIGAHWQRNVSCTAITASIPYNYRTDAMPEDRKARVGTVPVEVFIHKQTIARATKKIGISDKLIIAFGDSYTAGQGSPDRPSKISFGDSKLIPDPFAPPAGQGGSSDHGRDPVPSLKSNVWFPQLHSGKPPEWWDNECNRSLLAWPVLASLKLASTYADEAQNDAAGKSADVQDAVTFASYACSGAEFYDGIFTPQRNPPGGSGGSAPTHQGLEAGHVVQRSQLRAAGADLCDIRNGERTAGFGRKRVEHYYCERPRKPDAVLMTAGGNDAGFAKVIMHALLPLPEDANGRLGAAGLYATHALLGTVSIGESATRRKVLVPAYTTLAQHLKEFSSDHTAVYVLGYPNPLMRPLSLDETGRACGLEMRAGMEAAKLVGAPLVKSWWHFWFKQKEAQKTSDNMWAPLQKEISAAVEPLPWHYVTGHVAKFNQHGLCADAVKIEDDHEDGQPREALPENVLRYRLPRQERRNGSPVHLAEQTWLPYDTSMQRWIRTPNDSLRTQTATTLGKSISGAFHPTGAGYAAMAQAAFEKMYETNLMPRAPMPGVVPGGEGASR